MARQAEPNLVLAFLRPGKDEDRLTEVLAGVIALDQELGRHLMGRAGVAVGSRTPVDVLTQEIVRADMSRMDMVLSAGGQQVWSEHKIGAVFQPGQLSRYSRHVPRGLVIVPHAKVAGAIAEADAAKAVLLLEGIQANIEVLSWERDIARYLRDERAVDPAAVTGSSSAASKSLADLYGYLESKDLIMPRKIQQTDVQALEECDWILSTALPAILDAAEHSGRSIGLKRRERKNRPPRSWHESDYGYVVFHPAPGSWVYDAGGRFEVLVAGRSPGIGGAGVSVGATLDWSECSPVAREQVMSDEWEVILGSAGFELIPEAWGAVRAIQVTPLGEVEGTDLTEQSETVARSFERCVADLMALEGAWRDLERERQVDVPDDLDA